MAIVSISRRIFTLVEVIIALSLTAVVMTALSYFYLQVQEINTRTEKALRNLYQLSYLEMRLATVLPKALSETDPKNNFFFFTSLEGNEVIKQGTSSLIFSYNNGINLNRQFASHVLGRLFLDTQNRLILATWPIPKRWKEGASPEMKKEILMEDVESLSFSFFVALAADRSKVVEIKDKVKDKKIFTPSPPGAWIQEWKFEYYELPAILRIHIKKNSSPSQEKKEEITFTFPLPNSNNVIMYTK